MAVGLSFFALLLTGVPIAFVLAASALIYVAVSGNTVLFQSYPSQFFGGLESYGLLALPLFILLGELMNEGGIGRRLMTLAMAMMGQVRGGLAYVNLAANVMMASILGSTVAQIVVMSRLAVPEMDRAGYPRDVSMSITAAAGMLAPIIPPSMLFIVYGVIAQISIGDLFIAGIVPGLLLAAAFLVVIAVLGRIHGFPTNEKMSWNARLKAVADALPAALIPITIVGSILGGLATPTEAAAMAAIVSILIGKFVYRELEISHLGPAFVRAARSSAVVLFVIAAAGVFSWVITFENIPTLVADWLQDLTTSPIVFLLVLNLLLLLVGMIIDPIPALILIVPVLLPVATDVYQINATHFGVIICLNLAAGLLTPPVGTGLFTAALMSGIKAERIALLVAPFLAAAAAVIVLLVLFPGLMSLI
ncbi:tripartite ATP-independent transporter DctM subunit [Rhodobium orientis]|uniref:TRAP transporter large permease protein n=1 Tax=Rhodobium orientis TaxID=34017 RepID=A0A327JIY7_9HYPH|nr:TRAP transporter large permease [Rhodobium orientis]MBB4301882.1 tripartite ATP-independent transporter DctM subunit [Rhodobium orientis]MBK5950120.1 C4-dicarboxylate ABC transporter permease [Rhodobium orientis]RAI25676.1 C4-dicarboxylate ABC transporter permease [Rhodobium orientis]